MSRQQRHRCFNKKYSSHCFIRLFLTLKQERGLFLFLGIGNRNFCYRDFLRWWERDSVVKNEKCIVFWESLYVNANPGWYPRWSVYKGNYSKHRLLAQMKRKCEIDEFWGLATFLCIVFFSIIKFITN